MKRLFSYVYEEIKTCSVSTDEVLHQLRNYSNARPRRSHTIMRLLENNAYCYNDTINYDSFIAFFFFEGVGGFYIYPYLQSLKTMLFLPCQKVMCGVGLFMELWRVLESSTKTLNWFLSPPLYIVSMLTCKSRIVPEINSCSLNTSFEFSAVDVKEKSKQLMWGHKQLLEEQPLPG